MSKQRTVEFLTPEEHSVISAWFGAEPPAGTPSLDEAIAALGFVEGDWGPPQVPWVVAYIVLESVEHDLPQWQDWQGAQIVYGRIYRSPRAVPNRLTKPQCYHLFTINWATSAPGIDWPLAYYVTWVPRYRRYIVTVSADCPESLGGHTDTALGHFSGNVDLHDACQDIIAKTWSGRRHRWESLTSTGIVNSYAVEYWADQIWGTPEEKEDDDSVPQGGIEGAILRANPGLTEEDLEEMMKAH